MAIPIQRLISDFIFREIRVEELPLALEVRRAVYIEELGYDDERILLDPFDQRAHHFLATTREGNPIAALRMLAWDVRPFEFEHFVDASSLLPPASRAAEISRNCILPEFRPLTRFQFVHAGMWKLAYDCAARLGLADLWIWAIPRVAKIYEYVGFCNVPIPQFRHPLFRFQFYQLMRLDLRTLEENYRRRHHPFTEFLFGPGLTSSTSDPGAR